MPMELPIPLVRPRRDFLLRITSLAAAVCAGAHSLPAQSLSILRDHELKRLADNFNMHRDKVRLIFVFSPT